MSDINDNGYPTLQNNVLDAVSDEEIQLYEKLNLALRENKDEFKVVFSDIDIDNGIEFGITAPKEIGLPISVGSLFFNVDFNYNVAVESTTKPFINDQNYYHITLKNCC